MRTLGLIGGMSWNSTELYYRLINQAVARELGALHSAKILLHSFDFAEIAQLQKTGNWAEAGTRMTDAGLKLKASGADAIVICTNTMHVLAPEVKAATGLPVLHIADAVALALKARNIHTAGILGTYYTMSMDFYAEYFRTQHGIRLIAPPEEAMQTINHIIYDELCKGEVRDASRNTYLSAMRGLQHNGAQAIILGCTEICMLVQASDYPSLPLFDSTLLHAEYAVAYAVGGTSASLIQKAAVAG